ncbi:MAG: 16S rRNA processing protein RimM [Candidatus Nitrohelix vancouverensis]|uniref:Ribosome maturation factor RimM n=1 Tax=Candidatus Nitrohelix vancouverensis TaxID=2705534 RepID=A0A7T0BZQ8_9BACT|nr:MAG: 16S rRNA processing protein RimM [Candidatus Nitrohelix vancouverensis]
MDEQASCQWVAVGALTKTHGLKGEIKFHPFVSDPQIIDSIHSVRLGREDAEPESRVYQVDSLRGHFPKLILKFSDVSSIEDVQAFSGRTVYVQEADFSPLPEGEYYWFEIEGIEVFDEEGNFFGRVEEIIETGAADVYVVRDGEREFMLPMTDSIVKEVDLEQRRLIFHRLEGLIEDPQD